MAVWIDLILPPVSSTLFTAMNDLITICENGELQLVSTGSEELQMLLKLMCDLGSRHRAPVSLITLSTTVEEITRFMFLPSYSIALELWASFFDLA